MGNLEKNIGKWLENVLRKKLYCSNFFFVLWTLFSLIGLLIWFVQKENYEINRS